MIQVNYIHREERINLDYETLAADYKARGFDRRDAYSQLVIDKGLRPGIDAKPFMAIFDSVSAIPYRGEIRQANGQKYRLTYPAGYSRNAVIVGQDEYRILWVDEHGNTGSDLFASGVQIEPID